MNNQKIKILFFSLSISIIGLLLDSDPKEPNTIIRFTEFIFMTAIIFIILFLLQNVFQFIKSRFLVSKN